MGLSTNCWHPRLFKLLHAVVIMDLAVFVQEIMLEWPVDKALSPLLAWARKTLLQPPPAPVIMSMPKCMTGQNCLKCCVLSSER
eukprot:14320521-Heterocapsa_arctica.AAC.1